MYIYFTWHSYLLGVPKFPWGRGLVELHDTSVFVLHSQARICYMHTSKCAHSVLLAFNYKNTHRLWSVLWVVLLKAGCSGLHQSWLSFLFPAPLFLYSAFSSLPSEIEKAEMHTWGAYPWFYLCIVQVDWNGLWLEVTTRFFAGTDALLNLCPPFSAFFILHLRLTDNEPIFAFKN